ncbi:MAG TPA: hypothetical protein VF077_12430 [Nitrospiraceae bacterium]
MAGIASALLLFVGAGRRLSKDMLPEKFEEAPLAASGIFDGQLVAGGNLVVRPLVEKILEGLPALRGKTAAMGAHRAVEPGVQIGRLHGLREGGGPEHGHRESVAAGAGGLNARHGIAPREIIPARIAHPAHHIELGEDRERDAQRRGPRAQGIGESGHPRIFELGQIERGRGVRLAAVGTPGQPVHTPAEVGQIGLGRRGERDRVRVGYTRQHRTSPYEAMGVEDAPPSLPGAAARPRLQMDSA